MHVPYLGPRSLASALGRTMLLGLAMLLVIIEIVGQRVPLLAMESSHRSLSGDNSITSRLSQPTTYPICPSTINFGEMIQCSIDAVAEVDTYTFVAAGDDRVRLRMTRISDTLRPRARIYNSIGDEVCGAAYGDPTVEISNCLLHTGGAYSVRVDDTYGANVGDYTLYLQRLNNPGHAIPMTFGQSLTGKIEALAEIDAYTFVAEGDDKIRVRMTRISDTLRPRIAIFNSAGNQICGASYGNPTAEIGSCTLVSAGNYTMLVDDTYIGNVGSYTLYLQRLNNPGEATSISFGKTLTNAINSLAEIDTYTFSANVDDKIRVRMTRISDTLRPRIAIFNSAGNQICGASYGNPTVEIGSCTLVSAGNYTMLVDDTYISNTGGYTLYLQRLNNPGEATSIFFGQTLTNAINSLAEIDTYTFASRENVKIRVRMTRNSETLRPRMVIFNPAGNQICVASYGNPTAEIGNCSLVSAGTYTILADDTYMSNTGNYSLALECLDAACNPIDNPPPPISTTVEVAPRALNGVVKIDGDNVLQIGVVANNTAIADVSIIRRDGESDVYLGSTDLDGTLYTTYDRLSSTPQEGTFRPTFIALLPDGTQNSAVFSYTVSRISYGPEQALDSTGAMWYETLLLLQSQMTSIPSPEYGVTSIPREYLVNLVSTLGLFTQIVDTYTTYRPQAGDVFNPAVYEYHSMVPNVPDVYRFMLVIKRNGEAVYSASLFSTDLRKLPQLQYGVAMVRLGSPATLLITDPQGHRTGFDQSTQQIVHEIPDSYYSGPETEPQIIMVLNPGTGAYTVGTTGTDVGTIHLDLGGFEPGGTATVQSTASPITPGEVVVNQLVIGGKIYLPLTIR